MKLNQNYAFLVEISKNRCFYCVYYLYLKFPIRNRTMGELRPKHSFSEEA